MHPCFRVARAWRLACCDAGHASGRRSIYSGAYSSSRHSNRTPPQRTCHGEGAESIHESRSQSHQIINGNRSGYLGYFSERSEIPHFFKHAPPGLARSEGQTYEIQLLKPNSFYVFFLKKKKHQPQQLKQRSPTTYL